ncbi:MAG: antibiotic biosynthesis monooxygenase [Acidiferrobacterales bacterium]
MYAVIFRAEINQLDSEYLETARKMRDLALSEYGCIEFTSTTEGNHEISISYWKTQEHIKAWKENEEHLTVQEVGKRKWYKSYFVQIVEILRQYGNST